MKLQYFYFIMKTLSASKYIQILGVCLFWFAQTAWSNTFKECIEVIDKLEISQYQEQFLLQIKYHSRMEGHLVNIPEHDLYRFSLFVIGILLFVSARRLCRNTVFYYTVGISLGVISIFVLTLFVLKRFISKKNTFLFMLSGCSYLSYMAVQQIVNHWGEIRTDYWRYAVGYLLFSGFLSFAVCYKHGPITNKQSLNLLAWTLQIIALLLMYCGITYPPAAYAVITILVASKTLTFARCLICSFYRIIRGIFPIPKSSFKAKELEIRLLSEEEYREQGDTETRASLQELRENCLRPGFPAWEAVSRLRSPKRLAEFIRGGSHVTDEEILEHNKQYCLGGTYFEDWIFSTRDEEQGDQDWPNPLQSQEDVDEGDLEYYEPTEQHSLEPVDIDLF